MTLVLALVAAGYLAVGLAAALRIARQPLPPLLDDDALPEAVVVVAARDEEAAIGRCLAALRAQDYPAGKLSVVVADDHSTDRTAEIVEAAAAEPGVPVRRIAVGEPQGDFKAKALALHTAIEATTPPVILITDADCAPVPTWARTLAGDLADPGDGIACGLPRVEPRPGRFFDRVQMVDWELLLGAMSAVADADAPAAGMGTNMAVRREAYEATGGYPALPFSFADDFILVQAVHGLGRRVGFRTDPRSVVWSLPADGPWETYRQRRRWARGGLVGDLWVVAAYAGAFAVQALLVAGLVVAPAAGAGAFAAKLLGEAALVTAVRRRVGDRPEPLPLLAASAYMTAYMVTLPFVLVLGRRDVGWKGRRH